METFIVIFCTIFGTIIAWLTYQKTFHSEPTEEKVALLAQFKVAQSRVRTLQKDIREFVEKNNAWDLYYSQGVTFNAYLLHLEKIEKEGLGDGLFDRLSEQKFTKPQIAILQADLEKQIFSFNQSQSYFDTTFKLAFP